MGRNIYSRIPKVDQILENSEIADLIESTSRDLVMESIREELDFIRKLIADQKVDESGIDLRIEHIVEKVTLSAKKKTEFSLKRVINGTGVVIHTNLGRSLINRDVMNRVLDMATNYSNLEFDLETGERGSRYSHLVNIVKRITGAEDALVVNNNAAAVVLALSCWGDGKEVITSRGELVEIGGSFRIPEVMEQSGAKLVEVGATNKTHLEDYEGAINENTGALLKVHTSNYRIVGFTESVELKDLVELGRAHDIPVIEDLGSGVLIDLSKYGLEYEPTVQESVAAGADVITFSGDKLLGGPQAGIIIGKSEYIKKMKKHPLNRAFRVDKFTIAALEGTLRLYLSEEKAIEEIPTLKLLSLSAEEIGEKAELFKAGLSPLFSEKFNLSVVDDFSQVGGGSMPLERIPTKCLKISSEEVKISHFEKKLRGLDVPIIGRLYKESLYLDFRTIMPEDETVLREGLEKASEEVQL